MEKQFALCAKNGLLLAFQLFMFNNDSCRLLSYDHDVFALAVYYLNTICDVHACVVDGSEEDAAAEPHTGVFEHLLFPNKGGLDMKTVAKVPKAPEKQQFWVVSLKQRKT